MNTVEQILHGLGSLASFWPWKENRRQRRWRLLAEVLGDYRSPHLNRSRDYVH